MSLQQLFTSRKPYTATTFVAGKGKMFYDEVSGALRIGDGTTPGGKLITYPLASTSTIGGLKLGPGVTLNGQNQLIIDTAGLDFSFGDFYAFTNTGPADGACLSSVNTDQDVNLVSNGTGMVNIVGEFNIHKTNSTVEDALASDPIFAISSDGFTVINIPVLPTGTSGLLINGNSTEPFVTTVPGVTLRTVGNNGSSNTVAFDAHGTGSFSSLTLRASRGTGDSPTQTKSGDTIGRITGVGFGATTFSVDPVSGRAATDIRFVATEDFTDARSGTKIDFYTSPTGGTVHQLSASIGPTGITANLIGNVTGTATTATYAQSFNTGTLVTNAVNASTSTSAATAYSTVAAHTAGTGLSGSTFNGSTAITWTLNTATLMSNAVTAQTAGTVTTAAQPAITSVGTLTNLAIATGGSITTPRVIINDGGIRTINGGTTCTIDFSTDSIILWTAPSGTANITLSNRTAGARVRLIIALTTTRDIDYGISSAALSSTGADNWNGAGVGSVDISNTAVHLDYTCITSAVGGCYVAVTAN